jgi:Ca2+-binding EF-hand superfamily protein
MVSGIDGGMTGTSAMWQNLLKKADKDHDGKISKEEFQIMGTGGKKGGKADDLFSQIDANADGLIDQAENDAALKKLHEQDPGKVDTSAMFKDADKDGDGKVSFDEFKALLPDNKSEADAQSLFKQFDTNGDGYVNQTEHEAAIKEMNDKDKSFLSLLESFSTLA